MDYKQVSTNEQTTIVNLRHFCYWYSTNIEQPDVLKALYKSGLYDEKDPPVKTLRQNEGLKYHRK